MDPGETDRCLAAVATLDSKGKRRQLKQQWEGEGNILSIINKKGGVRVCSCIIPADKTLAVGRCR